MIAINDRLLRDKEAGTLTVPDTLQAREDIEAWEQFLAEAQPAGLLEFGTHTRGFSRWLADRVAWFRTLDVYKPEQPPPGFRLWNVLDDGPKIRRLIRHAPRPFVLFCDNGHKIHEVQTYAPSLCENDYLAVHDLGTEIHPSDVPHGLSEMLAHGLTGFYRVSSQRERRGHKALTAAAALYVLLPFDVIPISFRTSAIWTTRSSSRSCSSRLSGGGSSGCAR